MEPNCLWQIGSVGWISFHVPGVHWLTGCLCGFLNVAKRIRNVTPYKPRTSIKCKQDTEGHWACWTWAASIWFQACLATFFTKLLKHGNNATCTCLREDVFEGPLGRHDKMESLPQAAVEKCEPQQVTHSISVLNFGQLSSASFEHNFLHLWCWLVWFFYFLFSISPTWSQTALAWCTCCIQGSVTHVEESAIYPLQHSHMAVISWCHSKWQRRKMRSSLLHRAYRPFCSLGSWSRITWDLVFKMHVPAFNPISLMACFHLIEKRLVFRYEHILTPLSAVPT